MSQPAIVEIRDLNFTYDKRPVLQGINMTFPKGKLIAIMGLSGCGKTTLLRHIGGALKPDRGYVKFDGQNIHELNQDGLYAMRRKMGMLFQFGALFTDMSVYDNVAFQMREHTDLPEDLIHNLVMMKLHAVGLRGAQYMMPSELSGGMARRVALARTMALDPMLVMYDEPFAGLDPISMTVIGDLIRSLNDTLGALGITLTAFIFGIHCHRADFFVILLRGLMMMAVLAMLSLLGSLKAMLKNGQELDCGLGLQ